MTKAPNPKLQAPEKRQIQWNGMPRVILVFDVWGFSRAWNLELSDSAFSDTELSLTPDAFAQ
jgi:hypothetical protein